MLAALFLAFGLLAANSVNPQDGAVGEERPIPHVNQSITVEAHLTPEEVEDGRVNDIYQPMFELVRKGDCEAIIKIGETQVIPAAEQSRFDKVRKKFLALAYRSIGDCDFKAKRYADAEQIYLKIVDLADKEDSSYAINFESIALTRMAQQRFVESEEPLRKAASLLGDEVQRLKTSDTYKSDDIVANDVRMDQDVAINYLAVLCFRTGRAPEALSLLDQAYKQAVEFRAPIRIVQQIVENGRAVATAIGNDNASAAWIKRTPTLN